MSKSRVSEILKAIEIFKRRQNETVPDTTAAHRHGSGPQDMTLDRHQSNLQLMDAIPRLFAALHPNSDQSAAFKRFLRDNYGVERLEDLLEFEIEGLFARFQSRVLRAGKVPMEQGHPTTGKNVSLEEPNRGRDDVQPHNLHGYPPRFFFELAHWAKEHDALTPWDRHFIFNLGIQLTRKRSMSRKQEHVALRIIKQASTYGYPIHTWQTLGEASEKDPSSPGLPIADASIILHLNNRGIPIGQVELESVGFPTKSLRNLRNDGSVTLLQLTARTEKDLAGIVENSAHIRERLNSYLTEKLDSPTLVPIPDDCVIPLNQASIGVLALRPRIVARLERAQMKTLQQLIDCTEGSLSTVCGIGQTAIEEIKTKLSSYLGHANAPIVSGIRGVNSPSLVPIPENCAIPLDQTSISVLGLRPRIENPLKRARIGTLQQLLNYTDAGLSSIRNIGLASVEETNRKLSSYLWQSKAPITISCEERQTYADMENARTRNEQDIVPDEEPDAAAKNWRQLFFLAESLCGVFEPHGLLRSLELSQADKDCFERATGADIKTLWDLRRLYVEPRLPGFEKACEGGSRALEEAIVRLQQILEYQAIDDEVAELITGLSERQRFIVFNRMSGAKRVTLEMIGRELHLTRERVRQLETKAKTAISKAVTQSSLFYSASALELWRCMGDNATLLAWKNLLVDIGFLRDERSLDALIAILKATENPRLALPTDVWQSGKSELPKRLVDARKEVIGAGRKMCRNSGAVRAISLVREDVSITDVELILRSDGFSELAPGWWTKEVGKYVPPKVAAKVISHCGPVTPSILRYCLARHLIRFGLPVPPTDVLCQLLLKTPYFCLKDGFLHLERTPEKAPSLTGPERLFMQAIDEEGPVVTYESLNTRLLEAGYSSGSVTALIRYSPIVRKVEFGLYTLVGASFTSTNVDTAKSRVTRVSAQSSLKPRADGIVEFETNVGTWLAYGGIVSCGPAAPMKGRWRIANDGNDLGELIVEDGFVRGLSKVSAGLHILPGDRIRIEFNTWNREALVTKTEGAKDE